ncbi:kinetochore Sim4 complex subunit FTA2-domain-containing protein [Xylariaceae sp. FL1272]|nr:kinetochore Sim4 complex subunit FTA2-domain-containing protein [Xylariaceae sp. FL1272]
MAALPDLPGPKLEPFSTENHRLRIVWIEKFGVGGDATVWKVRIENKIYALKIVSTNTKHQRHVLTPISTQFGFTRFLPKNYGLPRMLIERGLTPELYHPYADTFTSECRAFGRLKETNNEHLAVKCFGYIILSKEQEDDLIAAGGGDDEPLERFHTKLKDEPLRAILKEYIELEDRPLDLRPHRIPRMIRALDAVHKLGIIILDIRESNYLNGVMMDFSRSETVPHPKLDVDFQEWSYSQSWLYSISARGDEESFDQMIDQYNERVDKGEVSGPRIWSRMRRHEEMRKKLRSGSKYVEELERDEIIIHGPSDLEDAVKYPRVRAELYDWKAAQEKRDKDRSPPVSTVLEEDEKEKINGSTDDKPYDSDDGSRPPQRKKKGAEDKTKKRKTKAKRKRH